MDTNDAYRLARKLMREHGLIVWRLEYDRAARRFGSCHYAKRTITLSRTLTELNSEEEVRKVILHEIAHALTPGHHHDSTWKAQLLLIGGDGSRTHSADTPPAPYTAQCATCGKESKRYRKSARMADTACGRCCKVRNGGKWSADYLLTWVDTSTGLAVGSN